MQALLWLFSKVFPRYFHFLSFHLGCNKANRNPKWKENGDLNVGGQTSVFCLFANY